MVLRIKTTEELYDIIDELSSGHNPIEPQMIVLDEHENYKEFIRIWPPYTVGNHLGATSESWAFEVESEGPNFGKKFRGSSIDVSILWDRIIMYREQLRNHYLAVTENPNRWDTSPKAQPFSTSLPGIYGGSTQLERVSPEWMNVKNNDTTKKYPTLLEEMVGAVKEWIGDKLSTEWRPSKGIIIGGFVLLWIFLLSLMLTT
jgi:hypothetical protein